MAAICSFIVGGVTYAISEHYFQARKVSGNPEVFAKVLRASTPGKAKAIAKESGWSLPGWYGSVSVDVMRDGLAAKFASGSHLARMLLATGNAHLEEANCWENTKWGTCKGVGQNLLGKLLMARRDQLASETNVGAVAPSAPPLTAKKRSRVGGAAAAPGRVKTPKKTAGASAVEEAFVEEDGVIVID